MSRLKAPVSAPHISFQVVQADETDVTQAPGSSLSTERFYSNNFVGGAGAYSKGQERGLLSPRSPSPAPEADPFMLPEGATQMVPYEALSVSGLDASFQPFPACTTPPGSPTHSISALLNCVTPETVLATPAQRQHWEGVVAGTFSRLCNHRMDTVTRLLKEQGIVVPPEHMQPNGIFSVSPLVTETPYMFEYPVFPDFVLTRDFVFAYHDPARFSTFQKLHVLACVQDSFCLQKDPGAHVLPWVYQFLLWLTTDPHPLHHHAQSMLSHLWQCRKPYLHRYVLAGGAIRERALSAPWESLKTMCQFIDKLIMQKKISDWVAFFEHVSNVRRCLELFEVKAIQLGLKSWTLEWNQLGKEDFLQRPVLFGVYRSAEPVDDQECHISYHGVKEPARVSWVRLKEKHPSLCQRLEMDLTPPWKKLKRD